MDYQISSVATVSMNLVCTIIPMFGLMCRVLFCKVCCLCCVVVCCVRYVFALCAWTLEEWRELAGYKDIFNPSNLALKERLLVST